MRFENSVKWFRSYRTGCTQIVRIKSYLLRDINVSSGVPQGSHLGPVLFLIFINDITSSFEYVKAQLFADDLKLYLYINFISDAMRFQDDLMKLKMWCVENGMEMNNNKCSMIFFHKNDLSDNKYFLHININKPLDRVSSVRDLGIIIDSNLQFTEHVNIVINKANKQLGFIMRHSKDFRDKNTLRLLYLTSVRSILTYNSVIWYLLRKETMLNWKGFNINFSVLPQLF